MAKRTMAMMRQDRPEIERLKALVEIYGGDRDRWPVADRLSMEQLVADDEQAAEIVAEAQALDRLLDAAPVLSAARISDLTSRIVAAAQTEGRWQGETAGGSYGDVRKTSFARRDEAARRNEAALVDDGLPSRLNQPVTQRRAPATLGASRRGPLASVAMLAASLVFGVFIGLSMSMSDFVPEPLVVADAGDDALLQQLGAGDDGVDALVEDLF